MLATFLLPKISSKEYKINKEEKGEWIRFFFFYNSASNRQPVCLHLTHLIRNTTVDMSQLWCEPHCGGVQGRLHAVQAKLLWPGLRHAPSSDRPLDLSSNVISMATENISQAFRAIIPAVGEDVR